MNEPAPKTRLARVLLRVTRVILPVLIALAGVALIVIGQASGGAAGTHGKSSIVAATGVGLIIAAVIAGTLDWMSRRSVESDRDRGDEKAARDYFDPRGHWPEETAR